MGQQTTFTYDGMNRRQLRFGDIDAGFAQADYIVEGHLPALADRGTRRLRPHVLRSQA